MVKMSQTVLDDESDPLGIDTYGYPKVDVQKGGVRISEGWFFMGEDPDEPACYMDMYIWRDGAVTLLFDRFPHAFELDLGKIWVPKTCQCYCECCKEISEGDVCPDCLAKCMKADYEKEPTVEEVAEWHFPEKLATFNPKGTKWEKVFADQIALVALAQYKRKHLVTHEMNEWLPWFAEEFSRRVAVVKKVRGENGLFKAKSEKPLTLKILVDLWQNLWTRSPSLNYGLDDTDEIVGMAMGILFFINGERKLKLVCSHDKYYLITLHSCISNGGMLYWEKDKENRER